MPKAAENLSIAIKAASQPNNFGFSGQSVCDFILKDVNGNDIARAISQAEFSEPKAMLNAAGCKIG